MPSSSAWRLIVALSIVQISMAGCNGCGDSSDRIGGTVPAPSDATTFTILVGRTTFRVPRSARFTDGGGGNYDGYVIHYHAEQLWLLMIRLLPSFPTKPKL